MTAHTAATMAAQRCSGEAKAANDEFAGHKEVIRTLTKLTRTLLRYSAIELGLGSYAAAATAARWCTARWCDGGPAVLTPNRPR